MSARTKLPGGKQAQAELTRFKYYWRDELSESQKDFWRARFCSKDSQATLREEIRIKLRFDLKYDKQLTLFRRWDDEQLENEAEAERQIEEERLLRQQHPEWDTEALRSGVIAGCYRRALTKGDFKLGLKTVVQDLNVTKVSHDERKLILMEKKAAAYDQVKEAVNSGGITPETLSKIERELKLL